MFALFFCIAHLRRHPERSGKGREEQAPPLRKYSAKASPKSVILSGAHPKAPSERGLPSQTGGGACATLWLYQILRCTHSPSVTPCVVPPPSRREAFLFPSIADVRFVNRPYGVSNLCRRGRRPRRPVFGIPQKSVILSEAERSRSFGEKSEAI